MKQTHTHETLLPRPTTHTEDVKALLLYVLFEIVINDWIHHSSAALFIDLLLSLYKSYIPVLVLVTIYYRKHTMPSLSLVFYQLEKNWEKMISIFVVSFLTISHVSEKAMKLPYICMCIFLKHDISRLRPGKNSKFPNFPLFCYP